ncbi:MAG: hypothetical protein SOW25_00560, partial [Helicobacter sp.]|nr:hypothetical protein [Helicobacter sp.]
MFKILLSVICFTSFAFSYAIENFGTQQTNTQSYDNFPQENFTPTANYTKQNTHPLYNARRNKLLGIYGAYNKATSDAKLNIEGAGEQSHDLDEKQYALGIQAGYLLSPLHRILANYEYNFKKNGFSYQIFTLGYAFTPQIPNTQNWRLLLGANAGLALGKFDSGSFVINDSAMGGLSYTGY